MKVSNSRQGALVLPNGKAVPGGGTLEISADEWKGMESHPVVKAWFDEGLLKGDRTAKAPAKSDEGGSADTKAADIKATDGKTEPKK